MTGPTTPERVNADFAAPVALDTRDLPWIPSPEAGVERRLLDRVGGEVARATSIVRYAPDSRFPAHTHGLGEELLVLDGVFEDEHGRYPPGTYVRNPPGSRHSPATGPGCVIFVKLRQMRPEDDARIVVDTAAAEWRPGAVDGHAVLPLFERPDGSETVLMERLAAGADLGDAPVPGGEEVLVVSGTLEQGGVPRPAGSWIRLPAGASRRLSSREGCTLWAKRGHLAGLHICTL